MNSGPERDTDDPLIGRLLDGRYRIGDRIARGGMAGVYEAIDTRLDRTVAVKVMHPGLGDDGDFAERFVREAKHAARLSHPNVVAVYDQGAEGGTVFLVMEYVPGHTLRDVIRQQAPMPPLKALALIEPVLAALAAAHQAGLIHRDIKPENVLIPDTPGGSPKVADFGLAKAISADTQHTATGGVLIGTVSYLAPELVVDGRADTRADVYAAGVVLFELLTGKKPHEGESPIQVAYKHVHEDVPPPSSLVAATEPELRIPPYLDALVARATARDREHRAADARVLLHLVRQVRQALADGVWDDPDLVADLAPPSVVAQQEEQFHEDTTPDPLGAQQVPPGAGASPTDTAARPAVEVTTTFDRSPLAHPPIRRDGALPPPGGVGSPTGATADEDDEAPRSRRRGPLLLLVALLLAALIGAGAWWFGVARWTTTPAVLDLTSAQAEQKITDAGLEFELGTPAYSNDVAKGQVLSSDPGPGDRVLNGGTVTVVLSLGKELYPIPDVRKQTEDDAQALLTEHFSYDETVEVFSETVPEGIAIRVEVDGQTVKAGEQRPPTTRVSLVVSKGRKPITVKDFTGKRFERVEAWAKRTKVSIDRSEDYSETVAEGDVISQSPQNGQVYRGDTIKVVVSQGPPLVEVPSVRAMGVDAATEKLEDLGFKVKVKRHLESIGLGYVISSNPGSGDKVPKGSTITLTVF
ncbi:Stk1 family PASTA domain-containing Ser/Thr kinase [Nocardioides sp. Bht2]|uniref:Stk1 family PASTA domain-containing Ser/Thr kinase n=1 Tax=Nocardioides sp. Bht2 TaxID=3392297 RepID=UPI0039B6D88C